jgi:arylsulfatase A-like enzyme
MRGDYLQKWAPQFTGGLARLNRGAVFVNGFQDHAITETAPGHATTLSGRFPSHTGIFSNGFGVFDPQAPLIGGGGAPASPFHFRGGTLIDWMRIHDQRARALSVSRKDRGAILPVGRAHQAVYWYAADGRFTTSTYYADTLPDWVRAFNGRQEPESYAGKAWTLLLPDSAYPEADSVPYESSGRGYAFPHVLPSDPAAAARVLPAVPFMDQVTLDFALAGVQALGLGEGPATDLLAISLSTTDAVGHQYGPDSRELHDMILRVDRMLGVFLDSLYRMRDSNSVIVALTGDHGVQPIPEVYHLFSGRPAGRVDVTPLVDQVHAGLAAHGVATTAFAFEDGALWVERPAFAGTGVSADSVIAAFAAAAVQEPGVMEIHRASTLARDTLHSAINRRWYHQIPPDLPIELVVTLKQHYVWGSLPATHGTPWDQDAHVPIVFYGAPFKAGTYRQTARVVDMAPTLAHVIGVPVAEPIDGHVLTEALRER